MLSLSSSKLAGVALSLLVVAGATAHAMPRHCPGVLQVEQHASGLPAGFQVFDREARHVWVNAQFSDGPPNEAAWLAPGSSRKHGHSFTNVWQFSPSGSGTWMACGYTGTSLVAAFRLPDSVRRCTVVYDASVSPPAATAVDCQ